MSEMIDVLSVFRIKGVGTQTFNLYGSMEVFGLKHH